MLLSVCAPNAFALEKYMPKPDADPHRGIDTFKEIENPNVCLLGIENELSTETPKLHFIKMK